MAINASLIAHRELTVKTAHSAATAKTARHAALKAVNVSASRAGVDSSVSDRAKSTPSALDARKLATASTTAAATR